MTTIHSCGKDERGVSEAIGFLLIFTMVIVGIGLVTLYGYPMLIKQQVNADEKIMEKNMIVLQNDVKSLSYKTVPYKETALKIGGGTLAVYNTTSTPAISTIDIADCPGGAGNVYVSGFHSGDLRYPSVSAGADISLQNGAVVKRQYGQAGSVMLAEPRWFYDTNTKTMVINLIGVNSTDIMSRSGIGTEQMAMGETNFTYASPVTGPLCFEYTPDPTVPASDRKDYSVAWDNYFMKNLNNPPDITVSRTGTPESGAPITYRLSVNSPPMILVIKKYDVIIKSL